MGAIQDLVEWIYWYMTVYGRKPSALYVSHHVAREVVRDWAAMNIVTYDWRIVAQEVMGVPLVTRFDITGIMPEELLPPVAVSPIAMERDYPSAREQEESIYQQVADAFGLRSFPTAIVKSQPKPRKRPELSS